MKNIKNYNLSFLINLKYFTSERAKERVLGMENKIWSHSTHIMYYSI